MGEKLGYNPEEEKSGIALTPDEEARREKITASGGSPDDEAKKDAERDATYVKNLEGDLEAVNTAGGIDALRKKITGME